MAEFDLDGFTVLPLREIIDVRSDEHERFTERLFRDEGQLRAVRPPKISSR